MNWTYIDFPRKITDKIRIESMNNEGQFLVKYLEPGGGYKTITWHPAQPEEKFDAFTSRVLKIVKKGMRL